MLAPQLTMRRLLGLIAVSSVFCLVLSMAVQGQLWAVALSLASASIVLVFLAFAIFFQISFVAAKFFGLLRRADKPASPFAQDTAPPTYVAPQNPIE